VGVVGYSVYKNFEEVTAVLNENENKIQVVCGDGFVPFGQAQHPRLWDYADGVDTLNWLLQ
jgi:hypothetical protein